jgi:hypothetical protein
MNWNRYKRKPNTKTAFAVVEGDPIFKGLLYQVSPIYIRKNAPEFSLVNKGKHICGFFPICDKVYSGDYQKQLLIVLKSNEDQFELILTDLPVNQGRKLLEKGELNSVIHKARLKGERNKRV